MKYVPMPIDTSDVCLSDEFLSLTELLAKNTHEVWAKGRQAEGWVYGEVKDSEKKTTNCMVPYEQLTEEEKAYDRNTAMESVKLMIKLLDQLGYRIIKYN